MLYVLRTKISATKKKNNESPCILESSKGRMQHKKTKYKKQITHPTINIVICIIYILTTIHVFDISILTDSHHGLHRSRGTNVRGFELVKVRSIKEQNKF